MATDSIQLVNAQSPAKVDRLLGIDAMRYVALFGIIFIHAPHVGASSIAADLIARFGVPFFFIASGYFLARAPENLLSATRRVLKRSLIPFAFWIIVYTASSGEARHHMFTVKYIYHAIVDGGAGPQLWFLTSLAVCSVLLLLLRRLNWPAFLGVAAGLYILGLVLGAYYEPLVGRGHFPWNMRNGPFFGFPFMAAGFYLARTRLSLSIWIAAAIFTIGGAIEFVEYNSLHHAHFAFSNDLLIGTLPYGVGSFLLALQIPNISAVRWAASLGRYSMGIYAVHFLVLKMAIAIIHVQSFPVEVGIALLVLILSTMFAIVAAKVPYMRAVVR